MQELIAVLVLTTLFGVATIAAGAAMLRRATRTIDPPLPPARANGLPALPGPSRLARTLMFLIGFPVVLVGLWCALIASVLALAALDSLTGAGALVVLAALAGGVVLAFRVHARNIRQPA
jgi:hypothetical protein